MGTFMGKRGVDVITGSAKADYIYGREGNDTLSGGGGNDNIYGGIGSDLINGDAGNDRLEGEAGSDTIYGGDGNDSMYGGADDDFLYGGTGADVLWGGAGNDLLDGGEGNDELHIRDTGNDIFTGGAGDDIFGISTNPGFTATITDYDQNGNDVLWADPYFDANASLAGNQQWEYLASGSPTAAPANGNGQATVTQIDGTTVLRLYNNDADFLTADVTLVFQGLYSPEQLQIMLYNPGGTGWSDLGIFYPGG